MWDFMTRYFSSKERHTPGLMNGEAKLPTENQVIMQLRGDVERLNAEVWRERTRKQTELERKIDRVLSILEGEK